MKAINARIVDWLSKCDDNIARLQRTGADAESFSQQYAILAVTLKVLEGKAVFSGAPRPKADPPSGTTDD
jgi:hypothetical protein